MVLQMRHFKICPSLFSPAELLVPHVHIVHCTAIVSSYAVQ